MGSEMVACGLSISEMSALFYRSVEVFMANRDQASFDSVYQVGDWAGGMQGSVVRSAICIDFG